jgi:DNA repair protein RadA
VTTPLTDLPGIGPATAQLFVEAGFTTIESIANADPASLEQVKGIGPHRAVALQTVARERNAVGTVNLPSTSRAGASNATTPSTDKSKGKKSKGKKSKGKKSKGKKI